MRRCIGFPVGGENISVTRGVVSAQLPQEASHASSMSTLECKNHCNTVTPWRPQDTVHGIQLEVEFMLLGIDVHHDGLLRVQIDAAINPGGSIGSAFQRLGLS